MGTDSAAQSWNRETQEIREQLRSRFPELRCVRCGEDNYLMRVWRDETLDPALSDNRIVELICDSCGFIERHSAAGLAGKLGPVRERMKAENG
jgi:hypothetical protein